MTIADYGRFVTVESDHKPLEAICNKPLNSAPDRIKNILLSLQKFDFEVVYQPGKEVIIADCLSRAPINSEDDDRHNITIAEVNILDELAVSDDYKKKLKEAADTDEETQILKQYIHQGWPKDAHSVEISLRSYYGLRNELSETDGIVFRGNQIVVPSSLRNYTRQKLHSSHLGAASNIRRAKTLCFWPGMKSELQQLYESCRPCQEYANKNQKEPFTMREIPSYPFQTIALDLATYCGKKYLICVDYFSNYPLVDCLRSETSPETIAHLKKAFYAI